MFSLLNSQIYEIHQQQQENNLKNHQKKNYVSISNSTSNLTNIINNNNNKKNKQFHGSYYRQEKMKVTTNFIEKFIKSEVLAGTAVALDIRNGYDAMKHFKNHNQLQNYQHQHQQFKHQQQGQQQKEQQQQNQQQQRQQEHKDQTLSNQNINVECNGNMMKSEKDINGKQGMINGIGEGGVVVNGKERKFMLNENSGLNNYNNNNGLMMVNNGESGSSKGNGKFQFQDALDKNSNEMMPSLSPSQSSTDQSISTTSNEYNTKSPKTSPELQRKKFMQMITFLDQQNQRLEKELAKEKRRRGEELSRIIKSLLCFEAKLKSEKKVINQKLYDKDDEIARLVRINRVLQEKLGATTTIAEINEIIQEEEVLNEKNIGLDMGNECKYPEALFCSNCRKDFYGLNEIRNSWTQTVKDGRNLKGDHHNQNVSTEHGSSSDETLSSSFYGARRSIRYTSKRTFGTFRDYMRSRFMSIDDPNLYNNNSGGEENASILSRDESTSQNSYEKINVFSKAIDRLHGVRRVSSFEFDSSEAENRSRKFFSSSGPETDHDQGHSPNEVGDEDEVFYPAQSYGSSDRSSFGGSIGGTKEFAETSTKHDFETSTDDWYASASDPDEEQNSSVSRTKSYGYNAVNPVLECVNQILLQQSMEETLNDNVNNRNLENGPISLDSNETNSGNGSGNGTILCKDNNSGGNSSGTVSRKRVHFSTKNSMVHVPRDDDDDDDDDDVTAIGGPPSIMTVFISNGHVIESQNNNSFNYESIYSNEYEPIGSEHNSSNLYVDMESKLGQDDGVSFNDKPSKQPPALPPKPANLIKFKRAIKISPIVSQYHTILQQNSIKNDLHSDSNTITDKNSEPDYCSISEVNVAITSVKTIADVHKVPENISSASSNNSDTMSQKTDDAEEIFADIPKLPNVAAIIAPSKPKLTNNNENFYKRSPKKDMNSSSKDQQQQQQIQQHFRPKSPGQVKRKHVPNILAEINKKIQQNNSSNPTSPTKVNSNLILPLSSKKKLLTTPLVPILKSPTNNNPSSIICNNVITSSNLHSNLNNQQTLPSVATQIIPEDSLPLEAEFDWYNLDAEYGKSSNQPDVIKATDVLNGCIDELLLSSNGQVTNCSTDLNQSIEYNLDEEFSLANQPDIIKENVVEERKQQENQPDDDDNKDRDNSDTDVATVATVVNKFPTICDQTPCRQSLRNKQKNFVHFIDSAGLSTKPLPRQRKIYFSGPFV